MAHTTPPLTNTPLLASYLPDKYELAAIEIMNAEKSEWDDESVFITDKVSYLMRNVIEQARKYYYGVFDNPSDEITGEDKTWVPLVEWSVESIVKSIDLDTKDILIRPGNIQAVNVTPIIRSVLLNKLKKIGFGQLLNDSLRSLARDGTVVVKTIEVVDPKTKKKEIKSHVVDLLNIWIDPSARTIQEAPAIIERAPMSESDIQNMEGAWDNLKFVNYSLSVPQIADTFGSSHGKMPYTEVWERWGKIKKSWVTKNDSDDNTWIEGHIVASGLGGPQVIHVIRANPREDGVRPYVEAWYKRVDGRWYGRGIAEMLFGLQEYTNAIVNIRKNNNLLLQNGIFLVRKGSGLTPDIISRIVAGGGLPVTDINRDIKQLPVQDFRQSSYTDEDRVGLMADRVTGAFDINRGEVGLSSVSATATLTRDRHLRDAFVLIQEGIGFFIESLLTKHYIPILKDSLTADDIVRISGRPEDLAFIDEIIIESRTNRFISSELNKAGFYPESIDIERFKTEQRDNLKRMGKDRFVKYFRTMFDEDIDVEVMITDERFNRVVAVQQLRDLLIAFSRLPVASSLDSDAIMRELLNLMGIRGEFFMSQPQLPAISSESGQTGRLLKELGLEPPSEQEAFSNAAGLPQVGQAPAAVGRPPLAAQAPQQQF